jgi:hypothetical protein
MDSMDLYWAMTATAKHRLSKGDTSAQVRREADEQARTGFSVSADYTRLLASTMARIEREEA